MSLDRLLQSAPTEAGIYSNHLRRHLETLKSSPALWEAFRLVVESPKPVELNSMQIYKLHSMGLVQQNNNQVLPSCQLYREYFHRVLSL
jgi:AAA-like domain